MSTPRLANKIAIITGAKTGIGLATAHLFLQAGAKVVAALRLSHGETATDVENSLFAGYSGRVKVINADVTVPAQIQAMVAETLALWGKIDVLVNNAGINVFNDPLKLTQQEWDKCFSVDLNGVWTCCQAVLPHMLSAGYGNIINISSVHGHKIIPGCFPYPIAKHGLIGLTRALGLEYAAKGIRVNSISPGMIMTAAGEMYINSFDDPVAAKKRMEDILPCKRIGEPEEVGYTALFLATDEARFINATDILIDGGRSQLYHEA